MFSMWPSRSEPLYGHIDLKKKKKINGELKGFVFDISVGNMKYINMTHVNEVNMRLV